LAGNLQEPFGRMEGTILEGWSQRMGDAWPRSTAAA